MHEFILFTHEHELIPRQEDFGQMACHEHADNDQNYVGNCYIAVFVVLAGAMRQHAFYVGDVVSMREQIQCLLQCLIAFLFVSQQL